MIFTSHLENPFPAIASLNIFTLLSTANEGVSQAILQAAFLKRPLISTKTGGLGEVCIDKLTGLNVPTFSPDSVAKAILIMKEDPALQEAYGEKAKALVIEKFTLKSTLDQMENVYKLVMNTNKR